MTSKGSPELLKSWGAHCHMNRQMWGQTRVRILAADIVCSLSPFMLKARDQPHHSQKTCHREEPPVFLILAPLLSQLAPSRRFMPKSNWGGINCWAILKLCYPWEVRTYQNINFQDGEEAMNKQVGSLLAHATLCSEVTCYFPIHPPPKLLVASYCHAQIQAQKAENNQTGCCLSCRDMHDCLQRSSVSVTKTLDMCYRFWCQWFGVSKLTLDWLITLWSKASIEHPSVGCQALTIQWHCPASAGEAGYLISCPVEKEWICFQIESSSASSKADKELCICQSLPGSRSS